MFLRQDILAGLLGGSVWWVKLAHLFNRFESKEIEKNEMYYGESVDCDIIMHHYLLSLQVHQNQQIVVLKPWLCGSVNLAANENIHHEEERTSFFCCSARYRWSIYIVLFAFIAGSPEPANCGLKTVVMWICESSCE